MARSRAVATDSLQRVIDQLDATLARLESAVQQRDEDQEWTSCRLALELLHQLDEAAKNAATSFTVYWQNRAATADGETLGALVWFRDAVHHQLASMKDGFWRSAVVRVAQDGKWVEAKVSIARDGAWVPAQVSTSYFGWPDRASIPPTSQPAHGRDVWYDQHVASRPVMDPLRRAAQFLHAHFGF
jgi:hypothetical protein